MAYHITKIERGQVGEISKIQEELDELKDALLQGNRIMSLVELSDMYGAMKCFLQKHLPGFTMDDLATMAEATASAFRDGTRHAPKVH